MSDWHYRHDGRFEFLGCWIDDECGDIKFDVTCSMHERGWWLSSVSSPSGGMRYFEFIRM